MVEIRKTDVYAKWLDSVSDIHSRARILARVASGNPGDLSPQVKAFRSCGVAELRIDYGPGYRVYYEKHGRELVILLAGGDKHTQTSDIKPALRLVRNL